MSNELMALAGSAAFIGFMHTIFGPDHYLPFVMMSWARRWSGLKTAAVTFLCGLGHIGSSVLLGLVGVAVGVAIKKLEIVESYRGNLAAWAMLAFGLVYMIWGIRRAYRGRRHKHAHSHGSRNMREHEHEHDHSLEHSHVHDGQVKRSITPWALFVVFVLGPCEPLIPLLTYPAAKDSGFGLALVTIIFGAVTVATMLTVVMIARLGVNLVPLGRVQRYTHALAGGTIASCALGILVLGL